jgi:hypothetical protein
MNQQFWPDGTKRSTGNCFCWREKPEQTQDQIDHEAYKADQLRRYALRKVAGHRAYAARFATPEALENHRANARAYEKKKRELARDQREALNTAATRVNKDAQSGYFQQPNMRGLAGASFRTMP